MEKYKQIFIYLMVFSVGFIISFSLTELATYLLNLQNTIANIFGGMILFTTFALIILLGYKIIKSSNK